MCKLILIVVLWGTQTCDLLAQRPLPFADRQRVQKVLESLAGTSDTAQQRERMVPVLAISGLRPHLESLVRSKPSEREPMSALRHLDWWEGRDLEKSPLDRKPSANAYSLWVVPAGEILVLKGANRWAVIRVESTFDPSAESAPIRVMEVDDPRARLRERPEDVRTVAGVTVPTIGPTRAFPWREFSFDVFGSTIVLRSLGGAAFQYRVHPATLPVARTGETRLEKVQAGNDRWVYLTKPDPDLPSQVRRVQQFLFRIVDGLEPLPTYGTEDEDQFAHAESVQTEIREEAGGRRVLIVRFPFADEQITFDATRYQLLQGFAERVVGTAPDDVWVSLGSNELQSLNRYFGRSGWKAPTGPFKERVRKLFPETE